MKASSFNIYIPKNKKGEYIIFNTLSGATFVIDKEAKNAIIKFEEGAINDNLVKILKKENILIDDNLNELSIYNDRYNSLKYSSLKAYFTILTTYACNLSCSYCYQRYFFEREGKVPYKLMDKSVSKRVILFIKNNVLVNNNKNVSIIFFGGESLINIREGFRILEALEPWFKNIGVKMKVHFVSNGTLLSEKIINNLAKYDFSFQITLAGSKKIHDRKRIYKNGKGTYEDIMNGLGILKRASIPFFIRIDVDKENYCYTEDLLKDLEKRFGNELKIRFAQIIPGAVNCRFASSCIMDEELTELPKLWELAKHRGFEIVMLPLIQYNFCKYLNSHAYILDPFGDVYKCEGFVGLKKHKIGTIDAKGKLSMDNLRYHDLFALDPVTRRECQQCAFLPACGGGCPCLAYEDNEYGSSLRSKCNITKQMISERIKFQLRHIIK